MASALEKDHFWERTVYLNPVLDMSHIYSMWKTKDIGQPELTKPRASSHILEIERGRYSKSMVPSHLRMCMCKKCNMIKDEEHFVTKCVININERSLPLAKVWCIFPDIDLLNTRQIFVFLMCSVDRQIQKWFERFIHQSFIIRNEPLLWMCVPMIHTIFYIY